MKTRLTVTSLLTVLGATLAQADIFHTFENLEEGFLGTSYTADGVTYRDVNNVTGFYPPADGVPGDAFTQQDLGDQVIIERAVYLYDDMPDFGTPNNAMTFGNTYVPGDNLSIGALASVFIDVPWIGNSVSFNLAFYENGPWGNIEYRLDAFRNGSVVGSDSFLIANGGGRDNPTFRTMSITGIEFDTLQLYATLDGTYTVPRGMIDNVLITAAPVPEPATLAALGFGALALVRKRKKNA